MEEDRAWPHIRTPGSGASVSLPCCPWDHEHSSRPLSLGQRSGGCLAGETSLPSALSAASCNVGMDGGPPSLPGAIAGGPTHSGFEPPREQGAAAGGDAQGQLQGEELSGHCTLAWWH